MGQIPWWYPAMLGVICAAVVIPTWELLRRRFGKKPEVHSIRVRVLAPGGEPLLDADCEELYYIVKYGGMSIDMQEFWPERTGVRVLIGIDRNQEG